MPNIIPILSIAPLFSLYKDSATPSSDSSVIHSTTTSTSHTSSSSSRSSLFSESSTTPTTTPLPDSPTPTLDLAPASPDTTLPITSSPFTPTHLPFHVRPFDHLNIWAYLAMAFLMLALTTIIVYFIYACYHSAKKDTSRMGTDNTNTSGLNGGGDEERGEKGVRAVDEVELGLSSSAAVGAGVGVGGGVGGKATHVHVMDSDESLLPSHSQSYNFYQRTHQLHHNMDSPSASEGQSLDLMVEKNLKRYSEAEATCNFASGINATSEHASRSSAMGGSTGGATGKPLKSSLKPSFLRSKNDKLHKRSSLKGMKKGVSFAVFRNGIGSINAGFKSVKRSGMRGLGMSRGIDSDGSDACVSLFHFKSANSDNVNSVWFWGKKTEMIQLRANHKRKHADNHSSHPSLSTTLSNPTCVSSSIEGAGSITQSSSSTGISSSQCSADRAYAIVGFSNTNESSDDVHNLLRSRNPSFNRDFDPTNTDTSTSPRGGPFSGTNTTYLPFHLRPPPPSPTPAHKQNVERQYAAYRRSKGFMLKSKGKEAASKDDSSSSLMGAHMAMGAELELTHSPVSPSPSPSPSFVKPFEIPMKEGSRRYGLALRDEKQQAIGKSLPPLPPQQNVNITISHPSSVSNIAADTYDAHNIRYAQPPSLAGGSHAPNTPSISQSPQMAMLWKEPKLSPISGEIISTASQVNSSSATTPYPLPIASPILSLIMSPSPSPTTAIANATTTCSPTTPSKSKTEGRLQGLGLFKGKSPSRSPSPNKSPGKRNGLVALAGGGGFSLIPTMHGPPRLPGGNGGAKGAGTSNVKGNTVTPEATRARLQTLNKLTAGS